MQEHYVTIQNNSDQVVEIGYSYLTDARITLPPHSSFQCPAIEIALNDARQWPDEVQITMPGSILGELSHG